MTAIHPPSWGCLGAQRPCSRSLLISQTMAHSCNHWSYSLGHRRSPTVCCVSSTAAFQRAWRSLQHATIFRSQLRSRICKTTQSAPFLEVGSAVHANHPERPARFHSDGTQPASFRPWDMPVKHSLRARGLTLRLSLPAAFLCLRLPARPASRLPFRPARFSFRARGLILRLSRPAAFLCLRLPALPA